MRCLRLAGIGIRVRDYAHDVYEIEKKIEMSSKDERDSLPKERICVQVHVDSSFK